MDISKIKVSVIIPCYNAAEYLSEALDSIIVQTHRNIEIICVDDGSIDNTSVLLSNYATQYNNVRVVTNECNLKLIKTLNKAIDLATGDYIARMDADDVALPNRIEHQLKFILEKDLDICGSQVYLMNSKGRIRGIHSIGLTNSTILSLYTIFGSFLVHPSVMGKASVFKNNKYKDDKTALVVEDYELWCRLIRNRYKLGVIPIPLLKYRLTRNGESRIKRDLMLYNHLFISQQQQLFFFGFTMYEEVNRLFIGDYSVLTTCGMNIFSLIKENLKAITTKVAEIVTKNKIAKQEFNNMIIMKQLTIFWIIFCRGDIKLKILSIVFLLANCSFLLSPYFMRLMILKNRYIFCS